MVNDDGLFAQVEELPTDAAQARLAALVGLDEEQRVLISQASSLLDPGTIERWSKKAHQTVIPAIKDMSERTPLIVIAGDVGTGKTELAENIGDAIARSLHVSVRLFPMSLSARGHGAVGEMTTLITRAFQRVRENANAGRSKEGKLRHATILLIDEADALAQSRELAQMHHEDRAGVNALIRGVDDLRRQNLPALTLMCTNRIDALDPAIRRRAAQVFHLSRPGDAQRRQLLERLFAGVAISERDLTEVVRLTGPRGGREYGCTYSDIRQRLVPSVVIDAAARGVPITGHDLVAAAKAFAPTRPFDAELVPPQ